MKIIQCQDCGCDVECQTTKMQRCPQHRKVHNRRKSAEATRIWRLLQDPCIVEDCIKPCMAKTSQNPLLAGLCATHREQIVRHGEIRPIRIRPNRDGITSEGYRRLSVADGETRLEHRVVMQQILGRYLWPDENVHHINGQRADNRPENLELWSTSQPPGQRIPDKVAWAIELLSRYAPERLAAPMAVVA